MLASLVLLAPLLIANAAALLVDGLTAWLALGIGVVGAFALSLPPWDASEPRGLLAVVMGAAASVGLWSLIGGSADLAILVGIVGLAVVLWAGRRVIRRA